MKKLTLIKKKFKEKRPVRWEMIPDIPLTKNQVVMYMPRQLVGAEGDDDITSAMINNYIKDSVMPRANGKTYTREHIAYLTAISVLKKSLQVKDIKTLIELSSGNGEIEDYYSALNETLDKELSTAAELIKDQMTEEEIVDIALELAVSVYAKRTLCEQLVAMIRPQAQVDKPEKQKTKKPEKSDVKENN